MTLFKVAYSATCADRAASDAYRGQQLAENYPSLSGSLLKLMVNSYMWKDGFSQGVRKIIRDLKQALMPKSALLSIF